MGALSTGGPCLFHTMFNYSCLGGFQLSGVNCRKWFSKRLYDVTLPCRKESNERRLLMGVSGLITCRIYDRAQQVYCFMETEERSRCRSWERTSDGDVHTGNRRAAGVS